MRKKDRIFNFKFLMGERKMAITISSGTVSSGLTTGANGNIFVLSGGKVSATSIAGTSRLTVSFGGSAINTSANGGYMYVMAGGSATTISGNGDRKSTRLNSSHTCTSRMPSSA